MKLTLFLGVLLYVIREIVDRVSGVPLAVSTVDWRYLASAGIVAAIASTLFAPIYLAVQEALGCVAGGRAAAVVALVSPVGKYLPGRIASVVGAIWIYRRFGVGARTATGITLVSAALGFAAVALVLLPFVAGGGLERLPSPSLRWLTLAVLSGGLILAVPRPFLTLCSWALALGGKAPLEIPIHRGPYLRGVAWTMAQTLLMGVAFWLVARAVTPVAAADWYLFTATLLVAGIVGFLAFFAPAGIGVREGLLLALLQGTIPDSALAMAVLWLRVNQVLVEAALALAGGLYWRYGDKTSPEPIVLDQLQVKPKEEQ